MQLRRHFARIWLRLCGLLHDRAWRARRFRQQAWRESLADPIHASDQLDIASPWAPPTEPQLATEAHRYARWVHDRLRDPPVRLVPWVADDGPADAAEQAHLDRCGAALAGMGYTNLGDHAQSRLAAPEAPKVRMRFWLSADRRSAAAAWRLAQEQQVIEAMAFLSWLDDGTVLETSDLAPDPFEPPAQVRRLNVPAGVDISLLHGAHLEQHGAATATVLELVDLIDIEALFDHQRELEQAHRRARRGMTDLELRNWLGMTHPRLPALVRRELDALLAAEETLLNP